MLSTLAQTPLNFLLLFFIPCRAQWIGVGRGGFQRCGHSGCFRLHLVHIPKKKPWHVCLHGVWVPPSVPGPGVGSVLPGGGRGDWQHAIELVNPSGATIRSSVPFPLPSWPVFTHRPSCSYSFGLQQMHFITFTRCVGEALDARLGLTLTPHCGT